MDIFLKRKAFLAILAVIVFCGCGYTTRSVLPSGGTSIHIDNFVNKIDITKETSDSEIYYAYRPGMESDITRKVIDKFIFDGNYQVKDAANSHFLLKGELVNFTREPLRYDANENVTEYRVHVAVNMELYDLEEDKVVWREKNFAGEKSYCTTGQYAKSESVTVGEAIDDLARRIVEHTVENW